MMNDESGEYCTVLICTVITILLLFLLLQVFVIRVSGERARRLLVRNRELVIRDGETKVISVEYLSADDGGGSPGQLVYTVTREPQHGTLGLAGQTNSPIMRFTQADVRSQRVNHLSSK